MIIGGAYYYNYNIGKCEFLQQGGGCGSPPFETLEECRAVCEK